MNVILVIEGETVYHPNVDQLPNRGDIVMHSNKKYIVGQKVYNFDNSELVIHLFKST
jgi:hypothetical protein